MLQHVWLSMSHSRQSTALTTHPCRRNTKIRNPLVLLRLIDVFQEQWNSIAYFATCGSFSTIPPPSSLRKRITQLHFQKERLPQAAPAKGSAGQSLYNSSPEESKSFYLLKVTSISTLRCPPEKLSGTHQFWVSNSPERAWKWSGTQWLHPSSDSERGLCCKSTDKFSIHIQLQYTITSTTSPPALI